MAMNPIQKKARMSFLLGMVITLVITGLVIVFLIMQLLEMKKEQDSIVYKNVYVVSQDIISGGYIQGMLVKKSIDSTLLPNNAITDANIGNYVTEASTSKIQLEIGTIITTDMINTEGVPDTADIRLQEYNMIILPTTLSVGDYVDIRLRLPSGEDYIVLSKKHIEDTNANTIWIKVGEDEILTMSNAIVEAYIMEGSLLYATTYVDGGMQEKSIPTFVAKQSVIDLMNADPNITTTAKAALAARYTEEARRQRDVINQATNGYSEDALSNIEENLELEIQKQQTARQEYIDSLGM